MLLKEIKCPSCHGVIHVQFSNRNGVLECEFCRTQSVIPGEWSHSFLKLVTGQPKFDNALVKALREFSDMPALKDIVSEVASIENVRLDYEDIPHQTKIEFSRELVNYCRRRKMIDSLVLACETRLHNFDLEPFLEREA